MKVPAVRQLRGKLRDGQCACGLWVTLESAAVTDIAAGLGLDWIAIDAEPGQLDWRDVGEHVRATARSNTVALVRLAEASAGMIQRALELGADGVILSKIETAAQLQPAIRCAREVVAGSDDDVFVAPILESQRAGWNIRELLRVPGADVFFLDPGTAHVERIVAQIRERGKYSGAVAIRETGLESYRERGFRMLGIGSDGGIVLAGIKDMLRTIAAVGTSEVRR